MNFLLAFLPILTVLIVMTLLRWGGQRAGPLGWAVGLLVALIFFGLNPQVFWVSQAKGLLLSLFVLFILWPALLLYNVVDQIGGIKAIAGGLQQAVGEQGLLLVILAWAFSGTLEGLAGFGLPIAVVAPMLVGLGVNPVTAVAAVAVGHAWSVTLGDMGVVFQTLAAIVNLDPAYLASYSAFMLGVACLICGLGAAAILKQLKYWPVILLLGICMSIVQYLLAVIGLIPLGALGAGLTGLLGGIWIGQLIKKKKKVRENTGQTSNYSALALKNAFASYSILAVIMTLLSLIKPLRTILSTVSWQTVFPEVFTRSGVQTPQSLSVALQPFLHPGSIILLVALGSYFIFQKQGLCSIQNFKNAASATWRSAFPVSIGVISMVGLAALMDYCGMSMLLARGLSDSLGAFFPLVSPSVGVLGAFATGSNNNSNVLFGPLQNNVAALLGMDARILLAAQTTGGALGSMIAPAKIIVGCSTAGIKGKDGDVLRVTLLYCLVFCLLIGLITWIISIL